MTEPFDGRRRRSGPARDFTNIGEVSDPAFVRPPDARNVFAIRSQRFADLAPGNPLEAYLLFLSRLAGVQDAVPAVPLTVPTPLAAGMPPLSKDVMSQDDSFARILDWVIARAAMLDAPEAAERARLRLAGLGWNDRLALAEGIFEGAYPVEQLGECLYVAAALQVYLTRLAAELDAAVLSPVADGVCPACGSGPVASMIVNWANADRARYCSCGLCATVWNYVRIKCTACSSTAGISYYLVEEQSKDVAVETCTACRSYIKHFHQHRQKDIEPFADDVASFGLDLLIREQDFRRAAVNPFMVVP